MKLNMRTLCATGALLLCSESVLANEATPWEKSSNGTQNLAPVPYKALVLSTDSLNINEEELSSITSLDIKGYGTISHSQLKTISRILAGAKNLRSLELSGLGLKEVPKEVFNLEDLKFLNLTDNNLTHIPSDIEQLTKLYTLVVNSNKDLIISSELNNLMNLRYTSCSDYDIAWKSYRGERILDLSNKNITQIPFDISYIEGYNDWVKKINLRNNDLGPKSFPNYMVQLTGIEEIDLRNNPDIDSIDKLPAPIFGMSSLKKILLTGTTHDIEYSDADISSVRKKKIEELNSKIAMIDTLMDSHDFVNVSRQLNVKKHIYQNMLDKLKKADKKFKDRSIEAQREATTNDAMEASAKMFDDAEIEADKATSQAIVSQSSYSKFGQFFELMWSRFTESRLGRALNFVRSHFFQH